MKKVLALIPLFMLISYFQFVILNQVVAGVSEGNSDTSVLLPTEISGNDVKYIFDSPENTTIFKPIIKSHSVKIYTNDETFVDNFNRLSSNGKIIFAIEYQVFDDVPDSMSGTFYIKNASSEYIANLQKHFDNNLKIDGHSDEVPIFYYLQYCLQIFTLYTILALYCLLDYMSNFDKFKRKFLLYELVGNRIPIRSSIRNLFFEMNIIYSLVLLIIFRVNTFLELYAWLFFTLINIIFSLLIILIIYGNYKRIIRNNFSTAIQTKSSIYSYVYLAVLILVIGITLSSVITLCDYSQEYYMNYLTMKSKPDEYKYIYRAGNAWVSEVNTATLQNLNGYNGYYLQVNDEFKMIEINCKYALDFLGVETCEQGVYSHSSNDTSTTYSKSITINPFDLTSPQAVNPTIKVIDDKDLFTSDMYWYSPPDLDYLNIEPNINFYYETQGYLKPYIFMTAIRILILISILLIINSAFVNSYMNRYLREMSMQQLHGATPKIKPIYYIVIGGVSIVTSVLISRINIYHYYWGELIVVLFTSFIIMILNMKKIKMHVLHALKQE